MNPKTSVTTRFRASGFACLATDVLALGLCLLSAQACTSAKAVSTDTSRLDQVRVGFALDPAGRVSAGCAASTFALHDSIHLSMQVTGALAQSVVSVVVRDVATNRIAWSEKRPVPPGVSYQTFKIGSEIALGRYRADSTLGGSATTPRPFVVHDKREGVR